METGKFEKQKNYSTFKVQTKKKEKSRSTGPGATYKKIGSQVSKWERSYKEKHFAK